MNRGGLSNCRDGGPEYAIVPGEIGLSALVVFRCELWQPTKKTKAVIAGKKQGLTSIIG
jgi:hypothetical protein